MSATLRATADLIAAEDAHTSGLYTKRGIVLVRGDGATVFDSEGRAYIDCVGGQGMANLGHGNAAVAIQTDMASGSVHFILDVNGYFQ